MTLLFRVIRKHRTEGWTDGRMDRQRKGRRIILDAASYREGHIQCRDVYCLPYIKRKVYFTLADKTRHDVGRSVELYIVWAEPNGHNTLHVASVCDE